MNNDPAQPSDPQPPNPQPSGQPPAGPTGATQQVQYSQVSARVPDRISRGIFATNALVLQGNQEFVCDFLLRMVPPYQLAARVMMPYTALASLVAAIQENLDNFRSRFGAPPGIPAPPPNVAQPNIAEVYEQMKIHEEVSVGAYANTLMITHSASDFCLDFILDLFPRPVVTCRVYMSAPQIPGLLDTLKRTLVQLQQRLATQHQPQQPPHPAQPPPPPPAEPPPPTHPPGV